MFGEITSCGKADWAAVRAGEPGLLQLDAFKLPGVSHGFFNRQGGVSSGDFASLNVGFGVGDDGDAVLENRARLKQVLGCKTLVATRQVHGDKVLLVDREPAADFEADGYDSLITAQPVALLIQQADCQAVIIYDPVRRVIGAAHVGWRGSVLGIIGKTVRAMVDNFSSEPADLWAAISPSLGPCCAEFVNYHQELPEWMHDFQVRPDYFDFWAISRTQLQEAGLLPVNIHTAAICTRCNPEYFSYRRTRVTGRGGTVIQVQDTRGKRQKGQGYP